MNQDLIGLCFPSSLNEDDDDYDNISVPVNGGMSFVRAKHRLLLVKQNISYSLTKTSLSVGVLSVTLPGNNESDPVSCKNKSF